MSSLFITGFSGFVGRNLVRRIDTRKYEKVYCLGRTEPERGLDGPFQFVKGCICDTHSYARYLSSCETVVHLAAATGKATPDEYFRVNTRGTELLIDQCQQSGVKNFLYVSSIAAKFSDKSRYYYAQSKERAEEVVKNSSLNYAIVRPTIVIGREAMIWQTLSKVARKPVLLMFGDGTARLQPIYIEDLIDCLLTILHSNDFSNEVFELGGPEQITFEHLMKRIHHQYYSREPSVIHVPLNLLTATVSFLEKRFYSLVPITAGQLSAFSNDGTIEMNRVFSVAAPQMKDVSGMLKQVVPSTVRVSLATTLEQERIAFAQYLIEQRPSGYVITKYCEAHHQSSFLERDNIDRFDLLLLQIATTHPLLARLVDSYTSIFFKSSIVRKKWILLLAILESCAPTHSHFDSPDSSNRSVFLLRMTWRGMLFVAGLLLSTLVLAPLRLVFAFYSSLRN